MLATRLRELAVGVVAISLLAACGAEQASPPAASHQGPSAHPTITPTERIDVAAAFMEIINDPAFTASASLDGSMELGTTVVTLTGEMKVRGEDSYLRLLADAPNTDPAEYEVIHIGPEVYERNDGGLWIHQPTGAPNTGGLTAGFDFAELRPAGTRHLGSDTYQVLVPVGGTPITPAALGFDDPTIEAFEGSVEFLADDVGSPVALTVTGSWRQVVAEDLADATFQMTFRFGRVGQWVKIETPRQAWERWDSDRLDYAVSYPSGWEVSPMAETDEYREFDLFLGPVDEEVDVNRFTDLPPDMTPGMWYQWEAEWIVDTYEVQPQHWDDITVAGLPARQFVVHFTDEGGGETLMIDVVVVGANELWTICWYSAAGSEEADRSLFESFLSTFQPAA